MATFKSYVSHYQRVDLYASLTTTDRPLRWEKHDHLAVVHVDEARAIRHFRADQVHQSVAGHHDHGEGHARHEAWLLGGAKGGYGWDGKAG